MIFEAEQIVEAYYRHDEDELAEAEEHEEVLLRSWNGFNENSETWQVIGGD